MQLKDKLAKLSVTMQQMLELKTMEYEDLRELTSKHYDRILDLETIKANLTFQLKTEQLEKQEKIEQLKDKTDQCSDLENQISFLKQELEDEKEKLLKRD